jgi:lactaldehyde reductase
MMASMPKGLAAATGMDALTHAIEGYITAGAWELSDMFHIKAIRLIAKSLRGAVNGVAADQETMALAQYIAGMGFSNVGLGVDHSMAHTLSAYYNMPHGKACATLLPTVMAYNAPVSGEKYRDIADAFGVEGAYTMPLEEARKAAIAAVHKLGEDVGINMSLKDVVPLSDVDALSADALKDACTPGNPRKVTVEDIKEMFLSLMK